jgi:cyanophycin synthetase
LTLGGAAPHNIANLLGACLVAAVMGVPIAAIRETAMTFGASATDNPGRLQVWKLGGVTVLTDYAHNPDGLSALCKTAQAIPATRRLLILGQAGNRDDESLRALPRAAFEISHFDRVIIKEMSTMLRGRAPGDIPRILAEELSHLGVSSDNVEVAPSEMDAMRRALDWARDGDLLVCPVHVSKAEVFALLTAKTSPAS